MSNAGAQKARTVAWDCGVPFAGCAGAVSSDHNGWTIKVHASQDEARRCAKRYTAKHNAEKDPTTPILLAPKPERMKQGKGGRHMSNRIRG